MTGKQDLDSAVERHFEALPAPASSISREQKVQLTLEALASMAKNDPSILRDALAQLGAEDPQAYQRAVPDMYDEQTGLMAKSWFESITLPQRVGEARTEGAPITYLILDIDGFKHVNDAYGHLAGDEVIGYIADIMKQNLRGPGRAFEGKPDELAIMRNNYRREDPEYTVARVGNGEEFAVILYDTELSEAYNVAERLRQAVADHHIQTEKGELSVTVSIGLAELEPGMTPYQLIQRADQNLLAAKSMPGKNMVYADGYLSHADAYDPTPKQTKLANVA